MSKRNVYALYQKGTTEKVDKETFGNLNLLLGPSHSSKHPQLLANVSEHSGRPRIMAVLDSLPIFVCLRFFNEHFNEKYGI